MKNYQKKALLAALSLFFFFYFSDLVLAAPSSSKSSLGVSPAIIEEVLAPGEEKKTGVWVLNITDFSLPIKVSQESFVVNTNVLGGAGQTFNASSWLKIDPPNFILSPYEQKKIAIIIDIPQNAEPGGHYATVYFQPLISASNLRSQTTYLSARVGVLVFLTIKGEIVEQVTLQNLQTRSFSQFGPQHFSLSFQNWGNVHLFPSGEVIIKDFWGQEAGRVSFRPQIVLPKTEKEIAARWDKKFLLGRFSAQADVFYGSANVKLRSEPIIFWVIPYFPLFFLTAIIILCILIRKRLVGAIKVLLGKGK